MVKSKQYVLVSLVLGLWATHGFSATRSAGVGPAPDPDRPVAGASTPGSGPDEGALVPYVPAQGPAPAVGAFTVIKPEDLAKLFFPQTGPGYVTSELEEQKTQVGVFTNSTISVPTATALLSLIQSQANERTLPFQLGSAIANVKGAYRGLEGLMRYQKDLLEAYAKFRNGGASDIEPLNLEKLFGLDSADTDRVESKKSGYTLEGGYTPLDDIKTLFTDWAEASKRLGDIFRDDHQIRGSLAALGGQAAAAVGLPAEFAAAAVNAFTDGIVRGVNSAAGTESPSLFNPDASVRDNVVALYKYVTKARDHLRQCYDLYFKEVMTKLRADNAAAESKAADATAAAEATRASHEQARRELDDAIRAKTSLAQNISVIRDELAQTQGNIASLEAVVSGQRQSAAEGARAMAQQGEWVKEIAELHNTVETLTEKTKQDAERLAILTQKLAEQGQTIRHYENTTLQQARAIGSLQAKVDGLAGAAAARAAK